VCTIASGRSTQDRFYHQRPHNKPGQAEQRGIEPVQRVIAKVKRSINRLIDLHSEGLLEPAIHRPNGLSARRFTLAPDWLRIGTDIIGGTTFNASFALFGETVSDGDTSVHADRNGRISDDSAGLFNRLLAGTKVGNDMPLDSRR
jgi:hypothetical protein